MAAARLTLLAQRGQTPRLAQRCSCKRRGEGSDPCNPLPLTRRASACKRGGEPQITGWDTSVQDKVSSGDKLHHEDLEVGKPYECGAKTVSKDEIIAFGRAYDPQPLHVDEEAAKKTLVGGLCASGWHTCTMMMRLVADGFLNRVASLGSPAVDEGRWMVPVRPGDVVKATYTIAGEARSGVAAGRRRLQGAGRALQSEGRDGGELAHQPADAPPPSGPRAEQPRPPSASARRSPACGTSPALSARSAPTSSSRTGRSAS